MLSSQRSEGTTKCPQSVKWDVQRIFGQELQQHFTPCWLQKLHSIRFTTNRHPHQFDFIILSTNNFKNIRLFWRTLYFQITRTEKLTKNYIVIRFMLYYFTDSGVLRYIIEFSSQLTIPPHPWGDRSSRIKWTSCLRTLSPSNGCTARVSQTVVGLNCGNFTRNRPVHFVYIMPGCYYTTLNSTQHHYCNVPCSRSRHNLIRAHERRAGVPVSLEGCAVGLKFV